MKKETRLIKHLRSHSGSLELRPVRLVGCTARKENVINVNPSGSLIRSNVQEKEHCPERPESLARDLSLTLIM